jgi:ADP-ribosylglycohydrolase
MGLAHNESFAVEAGAVTAAAYAEAFSPGSTIQSVIDVSLSCARDGTHRAVEAATKACRPGSDLRRFVREVRASVAEFDPRGEHAADDNPTTTAGPATDVHRPSRIASIEELPVALAALQWGDGDFLRTLSSAVFYGRDCDSIASMACGLFGALYGETAIPESLRRSSDAANRRDFPALARMLCEAALAIFRKDDLRHARRAKSVAAGERVRPATQGVTRRRARRRPGATMM